MTIWNTPKMTLSFILRELTKANSLVVEYQTGSNPNL